MEHYNNYVTVDLDIIRQNYRIICKAAQVPVLAVVKANAYGHDVNIVAPLLQKAGADLPEPHLRHKAHRKKHRSLYLHITATKDGL